RLLLMRRCLRRWPHIVCYKLAKRTDGGRPRRLASLLQRQQREQQLRHAVSLLQMRITREYERLDPEIRIFLHPLSDDVRTADQRRACAAADKANPCP